MNKHGKLEEGINPKHMHEVIVSEMISNSWFRTRFGVHFNVMLEITFLFRVKYLISS